CVNAVLARRRDWMRRHCLRHRQVGGVERDRRAGDIRYGDVRSVADPRCVPAVAGRLALRYSERAPRAAAAEHLGDHGGGVSAATTKAWNVHTGMTRVSRK